MKNKRILSLGMAVTMLVSVLAVPVNVHADAIEPEDSSQEEDYFDDYDPDCPEYERRMIMLCILTSRLMEVHYFQLNRTTVM